eukprot:jgi/Chrpa1/9452/Chrysochromulina_OHIO_Genome00018983-RA
MDKNHARAYVNVTTNQAAHSIGRLRFELNKLAALGNPQTAAHAIRLLKWAAAQQQRRLAKKIAQSDARDVTARAAAQNDDDQNDDDKIDCENEHDDDCDYSNDCDHQQRLPTQLK